MSTLYRTPNIVIDEFEFHMLARLRKGRVHRYVFWRPLSEKPHRWQGIGYFKGHPPKPRVMRERFAPFKRHMNQAIQSVSENRRAAIELKGMAA